MTAAARPGYAGAAASTRTPSSSELEAFMQEPLPDILVGPLLRRCDPQRLVLWLVATRPLALRLTLSVNGESHTHDLANATTCLAIGDHAYCHLDRKSVV